jgi:hypothetical protein
MNVEIGALGLCWGVLVSLVTIRLRVGARSAATVIGYLLLVVLLSWLLGYYVFSYALGGG